MPKTLWVRLCTPTILAASLLGAGAVRAAEPPAQSPPVAQDEILRELRAMAARITVLENELRAEKAAHAVAPAKAPAAVTSTPASAPFTVQAPAASPTAAQPIPPQGTPAQTKQAEDKGLFGLAPSPIEGLTFGAYGELKYGGKQNPSAGGQWQTGFDAARVVLLPSYQITDDIVFNAEIEFEHAGSGFDNDDKLHGTAEIEQAYIDFKPSPYLNIRSPGVDLVPVGYINLHHEPTLFYSVDRPELANGLIPSTWAAPATGVYGKIVDNLNYQVQLSKGLEDFGDSFDSRTDANTVPTGSYMAGIDGKNALGFSKAPLGDFRQLNNAWATTVQLTYTPPFIPGLAGSTAVYYTPNTTPRGAHSDAGTPLGHSSLTLVDTEFRYRPPDTHWEFRGEFVGLSIGDPANMRANNDSDSSNNVGRTMYGLSGEVAYHYSLGTVMKSDWEAVPFYRYTYERLQAGGFAGSDANAPTSAGRPQFHTVGVAVFPTPKVVLKLDYQKVLGVHQDSVLGAVGFFF
ncbi:MAG TPA: hypothetical protein VMH36_24240 [Alphaproteobacteria bacterium]|nr:hypothetical protein [Alphaproteobacteria bacterium]